MDLCNKETIQRLCKEYGLKPSKEAGQNFLVDKNVLDKIIQQADLKKDDVVLEVGPGFGVLTRELASRVRKVVAVELEKRMVKYLRENLAKKSNIEVLQGDVLKLLSSDFIRTPTTPSPSLTKEGKTTGKPGDPSTSPAGFAQDDKGGNITKVVANLPYSITSRFLRVFLSSDKSDKTYTTNVPMTLMIQKEVAERVCAKPGKMSLLAVSVQFYAEAKIEFNVNKKGFWPVPEVDSAVISIRPRRKYLEMLDEAARKHENLDKSGKTDKSYKTDHTAAFFRIVKIGFSARRKQLQNNLAAGLRVDNKEIKKVLEKVGLLEDVRAQDLGIEDWIALVRELGVDG